MDARLLLLVLLGSLLGQAAAESMRETEQIDLTEASGSDDEDFYPDYYDEDSESFNESSGSGDSDDETEDDDLEMDEDTPTTTIDNNIAENPFPDTKTVEIVQRNNDIEIIKSGHEEPSNEISMASTSHGFFSRTEVVIAVVAGGLVGLVFAIIIVLLIMRVRKNKKGDLAYDTVKKPIYKKAPTIEA